MMSSTNKLSKPLSKFYTGQVKNLPTGSQPDPTELLDIGPSKTTVVYEKTY